MFTQDAHGLLHIVERHFGMGIGQTVLQHGIDDALLVVPRCGQMSLVVVPHTTVAATRDGEHGEAAGMLGQIDRDVGVLGVLEVRAEVLFGLHVAVAGGGAVGPELDDKVGLIGLRLEGEEGA